VSRIGETRVGSVSLRHPVMTASGTAGYGIELGRYLDLSRLGAVVVKSLAHFPWQGNLAPRLAPVPGGMLNAVGLQGPGIAEWIDRGLVDLERAGATVVLSVWGFRVEDYVTAAELIAPVASRLTAVEVNLSCPNIDHHSDGSSHQMFAHDADLVTKIVRGMGRAGVPLWAKLSANTTEVVTMARAAHEAGAEAVTLINTMRGMTLVDDGRRPSLGNGAGGLSGRVIHPIALRTVHDVHAALPQVPIIGVGGVTNGSEAFAIMAAGASAVQVGTATFADPRACAHVQDELDSLVDRRGVGDWSSIIGCAHGDGNS